MGKFEIKKKKEGDFRFTLKATNGQVILTSESYTTKDACKNGIQSVRKNSQIDDKYEKLTAKDGKAYFNLKASNGQVIGVSETYESTSNRDSGIASVKKNAPEAEITDMSM